MKKGNLKTRGHTMTILHNTETITRGTKLHCYLYNGSTCIVTEFIPSNQPIEDIGGAGFMTSGGGQIKYVKTGDSPYVGSVPESIARGAQWDILDEVATESEIQELLAQAQRVAAAEEKARQEAAEEGERIFTRGAALLAEKMPAWAKGVIVASYEEDDCDLMTDYFNSTVTKTIIIGWSKHTKNLFSEMRKAAKACGLPQVAQFATAPTVDGNGREKTEENKGWWTPADEHRENYSMGAGYYLKSCGRYSTGWKISKQRVGDYLAAIAGEPDGYAVAEEVSKKKAAKKSKSETVANVEAPAAGEAIKVVINEEKNGIELYFSEKPGTDTRDQMKGNKWRWHRVKKCWYNKLTEENRAFAATLAGANEPEPEPPTTPKPPKKSAPSPEILPAVEMVAEIPATLQKEAVPVNKTALAAVTQKTVPVDKIAPAAVVQKNAPVAEIIKELPETISAQERRSASAFFDAKSFYPTPHHLIRKMILKIKGNPRRILEPSAGRGDLVEALSHSYRFDKRKSDISAIEIDENLQATLRGKEIKLIDSDFLSYGGADKFDLIIANPPFEDGEKHLLKAIDILYRGQIIFILNAETLRNPCTNSRKDLVRKLDELGAKIEYIENSFKTAARPTGVEIALVDITVERTVEEDIFKGATEAKEYQGTVNQKNEVSEGLTIRELVAEYSQTVKHCTNTITEYHRYANYTQGYLSLNVGDFKPFNPKDRTEQIQMLVNEALRQIRVTFWRRTLDLEEVRKRLTEKKQSEFEHALQDRAQMEFTESNVHQFIINLIGGYQNTILDSIGEIFEKFTTKHCFRGDLHDKNIHYFNGWKTNNAYKVRKKVILPVSHSFSSPFQGWNGWQLDYKAARELRDIDLAVSYLDGLKEHTSITEAIEAAFKEGENSNIESTYFKMTCHKKGTIHLTFKDADILRRFNIAACIGKGWLPEDYGQKSYEDLTPQEKQAAKSFDGVTTYKKNEGRPLLPASNLLKLAA